MAISKENAEKLKYLWQDNHEIEFIESFFKIIDKDGNTVPFRLTDEQKNLLKGLEKLTIVSKSRQLGISTVTVALSLRQCIVYPNSSCLLVSHDQKSVNDIFEKLKQEYRLLPSWLKPQEIANNRTELKFKNGSRIVCSTAGNKELGRGATLQLVHLSEFSLMKNQKKQLGAILQALSPEGRLIIESTSHGLNYYSELATQAENGENDFKLFFFNWINGGTLFKGKYKEATELFKARNNGEILQEKDLDDEEKQLVKLGASMEQLMFRRSQIEIIGLDQFHQEYPSTMLESFLMSGSGMFNNKRINEVEISLSKDNYIPKANIIDLPMVLKNFYGKSFFIWKLPKKGEKYFIGVDASLGVGSDYQVVEVFDKHGEQVAEFYNNKIKPYIMAEIVDKIGRYYNKSIVAVEKASGGYSIIEKMQNELKYKNMSRYQTFDELNKPKWTVGFDTTTKSKGLIINNFIELFETRSIKINSKRLLGEMKVFEINDAGKMSAILGQHDDSVMATAITLAILKTGRQYKW